MRTPGRTDLDIHIIYPGEGDSDQRANNRIANLIAIGMTLFVIGMTAAYIAGAWS